MFQSLDIFRMAGGLAEHAAARQALIAQNIANADTPGYRATELPRFSAAMNDSQSTAMRHTRSGHVAGTGTGPQNYRPELSAGAAAPNGNTVSIETEMMRATEVRHQHELALSVYKSALGILRSSLGR